MMSSPAEITQVDNPCCEMCDGTATHAVKSSFMATGADCKIVISGRTMNTTSKGVEGKAEPSSSPVRIMRSIKHDGWLSHFLGFRLPKTIAQAMLREGNVQIY